MIHFFTRMTLTTKWTISAFCISITDNKKWCKITFFSTGQVTYLFRCNIFDHYYKMFIACILLLTDSGAPCFSWSEEFRFILAESKYSVFYNGTLKLGLGRISGRKSNQFYYISDRISEWFFNAGYPVIR